MSDSQDPNNFQPEDPAGIPPYRMPPVQLASRTKRFWAAMLDGVFEMLASIPVFNYYDVWGAVQSNIELPQSTVLVMAAYGITVFFLLHGYFLYRYGQTIGKRLLGLAIVTLDNHQSSFLPLILNRYLPQWVVRFIPVFGALFTVGDVLYIFFNRQNRCVHDFIAGTKVIDLTTQTHGLTRMEM